LWEVACLNPGLAVVFNGTTMRAPSGLREHVRRRAVAAQRLHDRIVHVSGTHGDIAVEVAMLWTDGPTDVHGFASRHRADEGSHIEGFWVGLAAGLGLDASAGVTREVLGPGLVAAVHIHGPDFRFYAGRARLRSPPVGDAVAAVVAEAFAPRLRADSTLAAALAHRLRK
jgi:DNA gyrase/topoisomerase IV subunit B